MEQKQIDLRIEKEGLEKITNEIITNAMSETLKECKMTYKVEATRV